MQGDFSLLADLVRTGGADGLENLVADCLSGKVRPKRGRPRAADEDRSVLHQVAYWVGCGMPVFSTGESACERAGVAFGRSAEAVYQLWRKRAPSALAGFHAELGASVRLLKQGVPPEGIAGHPDMAAALKKITPN